MTEAEQFRLLNTIFQATVTLKECHAELIKPGSASQTTLGRALDAMEAIEDASRDLAAWLEAMGAIDRAKA